MSERQIVHWLVQDLRWFSSPNDKPVIAWQFRAIWDIFFSFILFPILQSPSARGICRKQKELKKYIPYCTQHHAITNTYYLNFIIHFCAMVEENFKIWLCEMPHTALTLWFTLSPLVMKVLKFDFVKRLILP